MSVVERFIAWGQRAFAIHTPWQRIAFQPILYLFLWAAALRITLTSTLPPIRFAALLSPYGTTVWTITALTCPPLTLVAWWLITRCRWSRSSLAGLWLRLGADVGQFAVVLIYHIVSIVTATEIMHEDHLYSRYCVAAILVFIMAAVLRDIWALVTVERIAAAIRR